MELTAQRLPKPPQQTTLLNSFSLSCSPLGRCESGQLSLIHPVTRKRLVGVAHSRAPYATRTSRQPISPYNRGDFRSCYLPLYFYMRKSGEESII
jgi:hypothetical protein